MSIGKFQASRDELEVQMYKIELNSLKINRLTYI